jgi:N-acetylmuramoyl-L-alanine amidase
MLLDFFQLREQPFGTHAQGVALSGAETAAYIRERLRAAGHPGGDLFEREALAVIAERSQGIREKINKICLRAMLEAYAAGNSRVTAEIAEKAAERLESGAARPATSTVSGAKTVTGKARPRMVVRGGRRVRYRARRVPGKWFVQGAVTAGLTVASFVLPYHGVRQVAGVLRADGVVVRSAAKPVSEGGSTKAADLPSGANHAGGQSEVNPQNTRTQALLRPPEAAGASVIAYGQARIATDRRVSSAGPETLARGPRASLVRELGLKVSRIAIDPGHGGYDTGAQGQNGLMEKDLCLDVALRLGRLIQENIPSAQVIYTRTDDRHVPLEERTAIANDAMADLLISIHANWSDSLEIRGVETYYVSLAASAEAGKIATRENAVGDSLLHNLPDLIKKLARNENLAESRQLASNIQNALAQRLQQVSRQETNRGVKRAPFIVLTGANMPAVLSEISFVSNVSDEKLLMGSEQRQRISEGLYRGIVAYLGSMPANAVVENPHSEEDQPVASSRMATQIGEQTLASFAREISQRTRP